MKRSFLAAVCVLSLSALLQAQAAPLVIGGSVNVGDANGNVFTPSPVAGDTNGLHASVSFKLNNGNAQGAAAGLFVLDQKPSTGPGGLSALLAFCLEPDVYLQTTVRGKNTFNNPYSVKSMNQAGYSAASGAISELWGRYFSLVTSDTNAAAFQVALWELAYGSTDMNLSSGNFVLSSNGAVKTTAQNWLDSLTGAGPKAQGLVVLQDNEATRNNQDLLAQGQVPEPGMLGLLATGLAGLGLARWRARHQHQHQA